MIMMFIGFVALMLSTFIIYCAYLLAFAFIFWMAVDAGKQDRFWWIVFILGVPVVGAAVYYFTEKKHEYAKAPVHHVHTSETESQHEKAPHAHAVHHEEKTA
jgi:hypothetical protein